MIALKKLLFALPSFISLAIFYQQLSQTLTNIYLVIDLSTTAAVTLVFLVGLLLLSGLFFTVFAALASEWKIVLPVSILAASLALLFLPFTVGILLTITSFIALVLGYFSLRQRLSSYLTFQVKTLLLPSVRNVASLLLISTSITFYLAANTIITKEGFKLPDSLSDLGLNVASQQLSSQLEPSTFQLSSQQANLLKENSKLLQQYGLDTEMLSTVEKPSTSTKTIIQGQIQNVLRPYQKFIPILLTTLFFLTLYSLISLFSIIATPFLWLIFWLLEKTGFVHYEIEMREVKKLVV